MLKKVEKENHYFLVSLLYYYILPGMEILILLLRCSALGIYKCLKARAFYGELYVF